MDLTRTARLAPMVLCLVVAVCGCTSDFAVPQEAQLGCKAAADCPSGWTCNEKVGRCVKTESIDADAPALVGEVTVAPAMLKKSAKATVSFSVSEELSKPPVVTLSAGSERLLTPASSLQPTLSPTPLRATSRRVSRARFRSC
mgnify:CR=1 FL=1